ncbi:MAG TPA: DUF397 domain-containing protein [Pseudonocardiaceae bacterium]|nr:DUF397 domain-containing protein [Pseudonocardiaceae bacterium]
MNPRKELADADLSQARWRKSSRSGNTGGNCVELASARGVRAVRDSKNAAGPVLVFDPERFTSFLAATKGTRLDH